MAGRQALFQRIQFAVEANPVAKIGYSLYSGGYLNTVSVGLIPLRWEEGTTESAYRRKFLEQELIEVSAVPVPANPNALALALRSGCVETSDLRELSDLLRHTLADPDYQPSPNNYQHLYTLARQIAELMRRT